MAAKKIEVLVLRNICTKSDGKIKKGEKAFLTSAEATPYLNIGAVKRPDLTEEELNDSIEGGDA